MKRNKVFVIGAFGYKNNILGGQTVKTRNIYKVLKSNFDTDYFDTDDLKSNPILIFSLVLKSIKYKNIFYIGGKASLKHFFPLLVFISKVRRSKIVYVTVGGWLYDFILSNKKRYLKLISQCKKVLVETSALKIQLESLGLNNVSIIPNFRITTKLTFSSSQDSEVFRIVFMARIVKEKGIYILFDLINRLKGIINFHIVFYGPIDEGDRVEFESKLKENASHASYGGVLKPDKIYSVLPKFDVLLLPTFHPGEGFPGTILDAYISGVPVIATNWKQIPEFIDEGKTGYLIEYDVEQLYEKVVLLAKESKLLSTMKINAKQKSKDYSAEKGLEILINSMFEE